MVVGSSPLGVIRGFTRPLTLRLYTRGINHHGTTNRNPHLQERK